jgi:hypothetical protein
MVTIRLLPNPRRAWLTSFGLLISMMSMLGFAAWAWYRQSFSLFGVGVGLSVALVLSARLWPGAWTVPYRAWNKMGRHYGEFARLYFLWLCYLTISAVGMPGPSENFTRNASAGSGWIARQPVPGPKSRDVQEEMNGQVNRGWIRAYAVWAIRSGQLWRFALLPFLILLWTLDTDDESHVPSKTYTLF